MTVVTFPQLVQRACGIDVHLKVVVANSADSFREKPYDAYS